MSNDLILEENNIESTATTQVETEKKGIFCLNCGTEVNDNFCPHCGQSTATPAKLKMKNFGKGLLMSFGRLTPGFLHTAKGLMFHPWTVIRDHIHGRHVPYSPPITMLIQIVLYATIIFATLDSIFGTQTNIEDGLFGYTGENPILKMIDTSIVVTTLLLGIPSSFCVYIAYYRHGAKKYNFAEYLAAFTYLFGAITLWDMFFTIFTFIPGLDFDLTAITLGIVSIFCVIILLKAFPQKKRWKSVVLLLWCGFVLIIGLLLFTIIVALPRAIEYMSTHR